MTSAILDDIAALAAVAVLVPVATGTADLTLASVALVLIKVVAFFLFITMLELIIFPHEGDTWLFRQLPVLSRFGIIDLIGFKRGDQATLAVLLVALLISLVSHEFGFHPAVGAYMAGLIIKQQYFRFSEDATEDHYAQTKKIVDNVAFSWIGPVFFVELGTQLVFDQSVLFAVLPQVLALTAGLIIAQIGSATLAARMTGNYAWHESILIGLGMLGRAELAFIVMDIGYVQNSIITTEAFYTLMATAFLLNVSVPVSIRLWKPYFEGAKQLRLVIGTREYRLSRSQSDTTTGLP